MKRAWSLTARDQAVVAQLVGQTLCQNQSVALSGHWALSLRITDDERMRQLNRDHRKLDRATDVLSFSALEQGRVEHLGGVLGDVVISFETVERAAKRHRRLVRHEALEVLIHGLLHIFGFDHVKSAKQAKLMKALQRQLFLKARAVIKAR
jgi:probable rRNA maturation factor